MRLFEGLLIVAVAAAWIGSAFGRGRHRGWTMGSAVAIAALFAVHWAAEGLRWPLIPAYAAAGALLFAAIRREFAGRRAAVAGSRPTFKPKRRLRRALIGSGALLYGIVSLALPLLFPVFAFAPLEGPYGIGTASYAWTDESRAETFAAGAGAKRELRVQVWYPADKDAQGKASAYVPDGEVYADAFRDVLGLPRLLFSSLSQARTHAIEHADLSASEAAYPVLIFSHGLHGYESQNTFQIERLVSEGYIVVGINHTYSSLVSVFPDGRVASFDDEGRQGFAQLQFDYMDNLNRIWVGDVEFVLDRLDRLNAGEEAEGRFAGRLDMERLGMFGHSFGGATALQMLLNGSRIQAAINMDGVLFGENRIPAEGVGKPFLMISADSTLAGADAMSDEQIAAMGAARPQAEDYYDEVYARYAPLTAGGNVWVTLDDTLHLSFSDLYLMSPLLEWIQGVRDARGTQRTIDELTLDFFDHYLQGRPLHILDQPEGQQGGYTLRRG